jgi:carboxypeptidase C (cathepsin A)
MRRLILAGILPGILASLAFTDSQDNGSPDGAAEKEIPEPTAFVTEHSGRFNGDRIDYRVRAGETYLRDDDGEPKASIFSFDYVRSDGDRAETRPVTFVWNGGPGSSSVWLHMGTLGPRRISVPSDASRPGSPPYPILEAPETILDVTDLVFIDPVGTGYSRPLGEHEGKEFWGLIEDATSMSEFIRQWITVNRRWNSPKLLLGESFGTTRAAKVAHMLESDMNIALNGIVFISQALDYQGSTPYVDDNLISFITYVPTMAATALYHGKVSPQPEDREAFLADARAFATNELLPALWKGNRLSDREAARVRDRLAYFTGISPEYIERANLRLDGRRFAKELLRDQGLAVGLNDARYTRDDIDDVDADVESDAASDALSAAFTSALMSYMAADLEVEMDRPYRVSGGRELSNQWRWRPVPDDQSWEPKYVNTAHDLSEALRVNPSLMVFVASGYYDLVTPFFDAEFTLNRHSIPAERIRYEYYTGGHMMYVNEPSRTRLLEDIRAFVLSLTR